MGACVQKAYVEESIKCFAVKKIESFESRKIVSMGTLTVVSNELVYATVGQKDMRCPLMGLKRYGFQENTLFFEAGSRCLEAQGCHWFELKRSQHLFKLIDGGMAIKPPPPEPSLPTFISKRTSHYLQPPRTSSPNVSDGHDPHLHEICNDSNHLSSPSESSSASTSSSNILQNEGSPQLPPRHSQALPPSISAESALDEDAGSDVETSQSLVLPASINYAKLEFEETKAEVSASASSSSAPPYLRLPLQTVFEHRPVQKGMLSMAWESNEEV